MKRYLSVIGLAAQSSFWKGLALIVLSAALAGLLLYIAPESVPVHYVDENGEEQTYEDTISPSELRWRAVQHTGANRRRKGSQDRLHHAAAAGEETDGLPAVDGV